MLTLGVWVIVIELFVIGVLLGPWAVNEYDKFVANEKDKNDGTA